MNQWSQSSLSIDYCLRLSRRKQTYKYQAKHCTGTLRRRDRPIDINRLVFWKRSQKVWCDPLRRINELIEWLDPHLNSEPTRIPAQLCLPVCRIPQEHLLVRTDALLEVSRGALLRHQSPRCQLPTSSLQKWCQENYQVLTHWMIHP